MDQIKQERHEEKDTSLHEAARKGDDKTLSTLLASGADVNSQDGQENTPLHHAVRYGHPKCVEVLLQHRAHTGIKNKEGFTDRKIAADKDIAGVDTDRKEEEIIRGRKEIHKLLQEENDRRNKVLERFYEERGMTVAKKNCPLIQEAANETGKTEEQVKNFISNRRQQKGDAKKRAPVDVGSPEDKEPKNKKVMGQEDDGKPSDKESKPRAPTAGDSCSTGGEKKQRKRKDSKPSDGTPSKQPKQDPGKANSNAPEDSTNMPQAEPSATKQQTSTQLKQGKDPGKANSNAPEDSTNMPQAEPSATNQQTPTQGKGGQKKPRKRKDSKPSDGTQSKQPKQDPGKVKTNAPEDSTNMPQAEPSATNQQTSTQGKGGKRKAKTRHIGDSSDNDSPIKRPKQDKAKGSSEIQASVSTQTAMSPSKPGIISVLMVGDEYGTAKGGVSTIHFQVAQFLQRNGARVHCTVLDASDQDMRLAERDGVKLLRPDIHPDDTRPPSLDWLTFDHQIRYKDIPDNIKCVVGHAGITSKAAKSIKQDRCPGAALVIFHHNMPEDTAYYKSPEKGMAAREKETAMLKDTINADAVFSVGRRIYEHFSTEYKSREESTKMQHFLFLPKPSPIFTEIEARPGGGEKKVLMFGRVEEMLKQKGHDLAVRAMSKVADKTDGVSLVVRGVARDKETWEKNKKALERKLSSRKIKPTLRPYGTQQEIADDIKTAHLVLMPSRSEPFGLVGLEAIAAGIPVLISDQSGLALMIQDLIKEKKCDPDMRHRIVETSVCANDTGPEQDRSVDEWAKKITDTLKHSEHEFKKAAEYKKVLLESKYWEESHQTLLRVCGLID